MAQVSRVHLSHAAFADNQLAEGVGRGRHFRSVKPYLLAAKTVFGADFVLLQNHFLSQLLEGSFAQLNAIKVKANQNVFSVAAVDRLRRMHTK